MKNTPHPAQTRTPSTTEHTMQNIAIEATSTEDNHGLYATANAPAIDMRLAHCGGAAQGGWQLGWAEVIGCHHPRIGEDCVASRLATPPAQSTHPTAPHHCHGQDSPIQAALLAVADGVGGGARGDIASAALAAHCVGMPEALLGNQEAMAQWLQLAEAQVQHQLRQVSYSPGASTLAAAWLWPEPPTLARQHSPAQSTWHKSYPTGMQGYLLRIGDARLYTYDGQHVTTLTKDQTYAHLRETPPDGATPDDPARMVGTGFTGELELVPLHLPPGHTLLLCSDGLHRGLDEPAMAALLQGSDDLAATALQLAQAARLAGSEDDISVLLARCAPPAADTTQALGGLAGLLRKIF